MKVINVRVVNKKINDENEIEKAYNEVAKILSVLKERDNGKTDSQGYEVVSNLYNVGSNSKCFAIEYTGKVTKNPKYEKAMDEEEDRAAQASNSGKPHIGPAIKRDIDSYKYSFSTTVQLCVKSDSKGVHCDIFTGATIYVDGEKHNNKQKFEDDYNNFNEAVAAIKKFFDTKDVYGLISKIMGVEVSAKDSVKDGKVKEYLNEWPHAVLANGKVVGKDDPYFKNKLQAEIYAKNYKRKYPDAEVKVKAVEGKGWNKKTKSFGATFDPSEDNDSHAVQDSESGYELVFDRLSEVVGQVISVKEKSSNDDNYQGFDIAFLDENGQNWNGEINAYLSNNCAGNDGEASSGYVWEYDFSNMEGEGKLNAEAIIDNYRESSINPINQAMSEGLNDFNKNYNKLFANTPAKEDASIHDSDPNEPWEIMERFMGKDYFHSSYETKSEANKALAQLRREDPNSEYFIRCYSPSYTELPRDFEAGDLLIKDSEYKPEDEI